MRLIIAVDPPLLATSLAEALAGPTLDVVVGNGAMDAEVGADLAIVSGPGRDWVEAKTVISLPDQEGGSGMALLRSNGAVEPVVIADFDDLSRVVASLAEDQPAATDRG